MAIVCAYVSGCGFSRVFRSRWSHEVPFLELDLFITICIRSDYVLAVFAPTRSYLALGWIGERRVMRDAEARSARSFSFSNSVNGRIARVS